MIRPESIRILRAHPRPRPAHPLNTQSYAKANKARVEAVRVALRVEVAGKRVEKKGYWWQDG